MIDFYAFPKASTEKIVAAFGKKIDFLYFPSFPMSAQSSLQYM